MTEETGQVLSTKWDDSKKVAQRKDYWCYAAVQATIEGCLDGSRDQAEVAHTYCMASPDKSDYQARVIQIVSGYGLADSEWATVEPYLDEADLKLQGWGELTIQGAQTGAATEEAVRQCIDGGGLVAYGSGAHYVAVYGYTGAGDGFRMLVWDPWSGGSHKEKQVSDVDSLCYYCY